MTDFPAGARLDGTNPTLCGDRDGSADEPRVSASFALLQRLATTLDLPVGAFMEQASGPVGTAPRMLADTSSLLAAFIRISCPIARQRCIDLVKAAERAEDVR